MSKTLTCKVELLIAVTSSYNAMAIINNCTDEDDEGIGFSFDPAKKLVTIEYEVPAPSRAEAITLALACFDDDACSNDYEGVLITIHCT